MELANGVALMIPRNRPPTHPGTILRKIIDETEGLSQERLAHEIGVTFQTINAIVNGRRGVTADLALRLGKRFDMTPQFWLNMQNSVDLWKALKAQQAESAR
jgi:addiction module HigA family antidote